MSQYEIMLFLDKNKGKFYSIKELSIVFKGKMTYYAVSRAVKKIVKREEYKCILINSKKIRNLTAKYGREE